MRLPYRSIFSTTTPATVRRALLARTEIALLDVRQQGRFATGHPLFAASFPLSQPEAQAAGYGLVGQLGRDGTHGFWVLTR